MFGFLAVPVQAEPALTDTQAILRLVVVDQARIHRNSPFGTTCVRPETSGMALDDNRERHRQFGDRGPPEYPWTRAVERPADAWTDGSPLAAEEARPLSDAAAQIIREGQSPSATERISIDWIGSLRFCGNARSLPYLAFSAPAIRGDVAFVDVGMTCGGLCGQGLLYALRRRESGWVIVSAIGTWVS